MMGGSGISWTMCKSFAPHSRHITTPVPHSDQLTMPKKLVNRSPSYMCLPLLTEWHHSDVIKMRGKCINCGSGKDNWQLCRCYVCMCILCPVHTAWPNLTKLSSRVYVYSLQESGQLVAWLACMVTELVSHFRAWSLILNFLSPKLSLVGLKLETSNFVHCFGHVKY